MCRIPADRSRPGSLRGSGLRVRLRFAHGVKAVDVVAEVRGTVRAVGPARKIDPDHRRRLREADVVGRALLHLLFHRGLVPDAGRSAAGPLKEPLGQIVDALDADAAVTEEP